MGCWNETCAVSKMAIYAGEQIRFLPIVQNPWHFRAQGGFPNGESPILPKGGSGCYTTDFWVPLCLPIRGKYNDYGSIEEIPEKTNQDKAELVQFIDAFKKHAIPLEVGDNEFHDLAIKDFALDEILKALERGRVYVKSSKTILAVSVMMIKETVWQSLIEMNIMESDDACFYTCIKEDGNDQYSIDGIKKNIEECAPTYRMHRSNIWSNAPKAFQPNINKDTIDTFAEFEYVHQIMSILRINYAPTCGSGSQTLNHAFWNSAMTKWQKIASKDEHRCDE